MTRRYETLAQEIVRIERAIKALRELRDIFASALPTKGPPRGPAESGGSSAPGPDRART